MAGSELRSQSYFKGLAWNVWGSYWLSEKQFTPPLMFLREGADSDLFFVTALSRTEVQDFINASRNDYELSFREEGDWVLDPSIWFGHWTCLTASPKQAFSNVVRGALDNTEL